jgi:hypothetical protein
MSFVHGQIEMFNISQSRGIEMTRLSSLKPPLT